MKENLTTLTIEYNANVCIEQLNCMESWEEGGEAW